MRVRSSSVPRVRSELASQALQELATHLFWIDADMQFDPNDVERLLDMDVPFVAGPYFQKISGGSPVFTPLDRAAPIVLGKGGIVIPIENCGFGFTCVRRDVFEKVSQSLPLLRRGFHPYFLEEVVEQETGFEWLSEDYSFCRRARAAGFELLCDMTIRLFHVGAYPYSGEDMGRPKTISESLTIEGMEGAVQ